MHYLIDGHNLIARMPDISLNDPDDEVQLILRLRSWAARSRKRQVTLFFDGGIPGGKDVRLSTPQVRVIFASVGQTADAMLIRGINKVQNPPEFLLVTSDQQIIAAAAAAKCPISPQTNLPRNWRPNGRKRHPAPPSLTMTR